MNNIVLAAKFIELFAGKSVVIERMCPNSVGSPGQYVEEARGVCNTFLENEKRDGICIGLEGINKRYELIPQRLTDTSIEGPINHVIAARRIILLA